MKIVSKLRLSPFSRISHDIKRYIYLNHYRFIVFNQFGSNNVLFQYGKHCMLKNKSCMRVTYM